MEYILKNMFLKAEMEWIVLLEETEHIQLLKMRVNRLDMKGISAATPLEKLLAIMPGSKEPRQPL